MSIEYEKSPANAEAQSNSAISAPGRSPMSVLCPQGIAMGSPSQVQCCTYAKMTRESRTRWRETNKKDTQLGVFFIFHPSCLLSRTISANVQHCTWLGSAQAVPGGHNVA